MKKKISVIMPVYNVERYLPQCLESVTRQSLKEIEIICINDGSSDSSKEILEKYQSKDNRIIIVNKPNGGYGAACNTGLRLSRGEYISIIEPDDFIDSRMFEQLYKLALENQAEIVKSSFFEYKDEQQNSRGNINKINWSEQYKMPETVFKLEDCPQFLYFHPSIWSCIYKREFLNRNKITFVEAKGAGWTDNPFQVKTLCLAKRIFYTDEAYYYYRLTNPNSSSNVVNISNPFDRSDEIHKFLEKKRIKDENLLAHLYKREFSYIETVLSGISDNLLDFACEKISKMVSRMDRNIVLENKYVSDYEKKAFEQCQTRKGILAVVEKFRLSAKKVEVVKY